MSKTFLSILSGLGGMIGWGTSDFLANSSSENIGHSKTFFWSQIVGAIFIAILTIIFHSSIVLSPILIGLTIFAGLIYAVGFLFFYKGFEIGNVSVVSAVVNLQAIFVIFVSLFRGQRLEGIQMIAIVLLLIGVTLVSVHLDDFKNGVLTVRKGVKEAIISSILFGLLYWPLNEYVVERADWLAVSLITKVSAITSVLLLSLLSKQSLSIKKITNKLAISLATIGILEAIAVLSVTFGQSYGDGILVIPISSALTVVTVTLAMFFGNEKINKVQAIGVGFVVVAIILSTF